MCSVFEEVAGGRDSFIALQLLFLSGGVNQGRQVAGSLPDFLTKVVLDNRVPVASWRAPAV